MKIKLALFTAMALSSMMSYAALPLSIDDLMSSKGELKLETSLSYLNASNQSTQSYNPITIQTSATSYVTIPSVTTNLNSNTDVGLATLGFRYGVTKQFEASIKTSYLHQQNRYISAVESEVSSVKQFQDAWLGVNYQLSGQSATQKVSVFADVALYEKGTRTSSKFKSYQVGANSYYSIDPLVLSISGAWRNNLEREDGNNAMKSGNSLQINPAIAFAANEKITLITGVQWLSQQASTVNGVKQGLRRTATDLNLGAGFSLNNTTQLSFNLKANVSGRGGAETRLSLIHTLGDKAQRVNTPAVSATGVSQP
jgi:hypothetical protein